MCCTVCSLRCRIKQSILRRGDVVANRWRRAALKVKLRNAAEAAAVAKATKSGKDGDEGGRPRSKVTIVDIARLAVADRDSNVPSEAEDEDSVAEVENTSF